MRTGVHIKEHNQEDYSKFDPIYSSSTLIESNGKLILVDPGHVAERKAVEELLAKKGFTPAQIDYVLITHRHLDHCSNMGSFQNARIFMDGGFVEPDRPAYAVLKNHVSVLEHELGVEIMATPGHTDDSMSYLYEENGIKYMCVGDAVYEESIRGGVYSGVADPKKYRESLEKIFSVADVIIPGHGEKIEGEHKHELYKIIKRLK